MMDPALKARWVAALRSGNYKQGHGHLHTSNGEFCCLGVLCDIAGQEWRPLEGYRNIMTCDFVDNVGNSPAVLLSADALAKLGLPASQQDRLWRMNDGEKMSNSPTTRCYVEADFKTIADRIERNKRI